MDRYNVLTKLADHLPKFGVNALRLSERTDLLWRMPTNETATVLPGQLLTSVGFYTVTNPVMVANELGIGITGTTGQRIGLNGETH